MPFPSPAQLFKERMDCNDMNVESTDIRNALLTYRNTLMFVNINKKSIPTHRICLEHSFIRYHQQRIKTITKMDII